MGSWTLCDIPWERFDPARVDPEIVRVVKAASLVEYNGAAYAHHLCRVFADDTAFQSSLRHWGEEEVQHGAALARWATLADPGFDFAAAFARFQAGFHIDFDSGRSRRGSRAGEMVARCIVETGTSSYYTAMAEAVDEPVLKAICHHIAADELRHYKLFYTHMRRYLVIDHLTKWRRIRLALGRLREAGDDELAYAYYAANETDRPYQRRRYARLYARGAMRVYRWHHVERAIAMVFKAAGLKPHGRLNLWLARGAWWVVRQRVARLDRQPA